MADPPFLPVCSERRAYREPCHWSCPAPCSEADAPRYQNMPSKRARNSSCPVLNVPSYRRSRSAERPRMAYPPFLPVCGERRAYRDPCHWSCPAPCSEAHLPRYQNMPSRRTRNSSCPVLKASPCGHRTPSGQRCARMTSEHFSSSSSCNRFMAQPVYQYAVGSPKFKKSQFQISGPIRAGSSLTYPGFPAPPGCATPSYTRPGRQRIILRRCPRRAR